MSFHTDIHIHTLITVEGFNEAYYQQTDPTNLDINNRKISVRVSDNGIKVLHPGSEEGPKGAPEACSSCLSVAGIVSTPDTMHISSVGLIKGCHSKLQRQEGVIRKHLCM